MMGILFSLLSAFFFASHSVAIKGGMKDSNPLSATLISSTVNAVFLWIVTILIVPFSFFTSKGVIYLVAAGLLAPSLARLFLYTGIEKVGVSISSPIKETLQFVAAFGAVMFLGEKFTAPIGLATVLTVLGVILLSLTSDSARTSSQLKWERRDLVFPFLAAVLYGMARILRKLGMVTISSPWGAGTVMATVSVLFLWFLLIVMKNKRGQKVVFNKNSAAFFTLGGILGGLGQVCMLTALKVGDVVIVGPVTATAPLFAISMTYIFFRKYEKITLHVILGALIIATGVVILAVASS